MHSNKLRTLVFENVQVHVNVQLQYLKFNYKQNYHNKC